MNDLIRDKRLLPIYEKVQQGKRINDEDALLLFQSPDVPAIGQMANMAKERQSGNDVFFVNNRHINYSNLCRLECMFCAFAKKRGEPGGYEFDLDEIYSRAQEAVHRGAVELHIVGGLHPDHPYSFYLTMLEELSARFPQLQLKCFTAVEIDYLAELSNKSVPDVLHDLKDRGLHSVPGGGAEILSDRVWKKIYRDKIGPTRWLDIHRMIHESGLRSNATILFGHIETDKDCVEHLRRLRTLQDETKGFMTYIPLRFWPENSRLEKLGLASPIRSLRHIAIGRLYLDNFPHIKTYWTMIGIETSQIALFYGADDFDGTVIEEKITHMAGANTPEGLTVEHIHTLIRECGRNPVQRDSIYNTIPLESSHV